jgi:hypothetical protein
MDRFKTIAVNVAVIAAISLLLLWGNTRYRQQSQYYLGERAMATGDYIAAIGGFEMAIHMYTPFSSLVGKSAQHLWNIGEELEQKGDLRRALVAYRALRSSFYAVHGLTRPGADWISRCDDRIAQLVWRLPTAR